MLSKGTRLNDLFEIDAPLPSGGMGEIYKGHSIHTGDQVAIKFIRADMSQNEVVISMFRNEAAALFQLQHEAIVRYFVFARDPALQRAYLAMELVEGVPLSEALRRGPMAVEQVCLLGERVALGLQAAHKRGIIHRDVSPDNIILQNGDVRQAKIIDFGIAKSVSAAATLVDVGFVGKYNYVSPEQLGLYQGQDTPDAEIRLTPESDIYSLGLVLAGALKGRPLDMGGTPAQVIAKRKSVPDLGFADARLRPFLAKMLQPDPGARPRSMLEVAEYFQDLLSSSGRARRRNGGRGGANATRAPLAASVGSRLVIVASVAAVIGGAAGAYWFATRPKLSPSPRAAEFLNAYQAGPCFSITSFDATDTSAIINVVGISREPFDLLDKAFKSALHFEADIRGAQGVTQAQCPVLAFFNNEKASSQHAPRFSALPRLDGQSLTGLILNTGGSNIELLVIPDNGFVQNVTRFLQPQKDGRAFQIPVDQLHRGPQPQLLMAVASDVVLPPLQHDAPADVLFPALLGEAADKHEALRVALQYFFLQ